MPSLDQMYSKKVLDNFSRHKIPYCIVMVDIDYFKKVNEAFGHQIGDKILENTAINLRQLLCKIDFFARIGGKNLLQFSRIRNQKAALASWSIFDKNWNLQNSR